MRARARRRLPGPLADVLVTARRGYHWLRHPMLALPPFPPVADAPVRLLVGPTNSAGQGCAWARSAARELPGVAAACFAVRRNQYAFPDDYGAPVEVYGHPRWQRAHERYVLRGYSHVLLESMRPLFGSRHARDARGDLEVLGRSGLHAALVFHGSDIRLPSRHAARERWSPFHERDELTQWLEEQAARFAAAVGDAACPVFVSTPDLLADVPSATWLPVVVDVDRWSAPPPLQRSRPVVVHTPSNPRLKGSTAVETAMSRLDSQGVVEYRRIEGVPNDRMPEVVADADIVVDQLLMGLYGVGACEAMAAGRVVVSYVGDPVRRRVRADTGLELPIVEADPATVADVVADLVTRPDAAGERAALGPAFVRAVHDGTRSAEALRPWLTA